MTSLSKSVTAMLDLQGIHPYNDTWHSAYDTFFEKVKQEGATVEEAIHESLDHLNIPRDDIRRIEGPAEFWHVFNETRSSKSKSFAKKAKDKLVNVATSKPKSH